MKLLLRKRSVITGTKNLEHLVTYKKYPVLIGCTNQPKKLDLFADMSFSICRDSGIIQLDKLIPLDVLYSQYHSEAIGGLWNEHHLKFVDFLKRFSPHNVLEIGGSSCFIAENYLKINKKAKWIVVEPNPIKSGNSKIKLIPKFFDDKFYTRDRIDAIVHSHVAEHMYDPNKFFKKVNSLLNYGDLNIFSVPNLYEYLKRGYSNCINFEHSLFLTEHLIDYILNKNGFDIIEKKYFHKHSIFYAARKTDKKFDKKLSSKYTEYKKMFNTYVKKNHQIVADINKKMLKNKGEIYLFGAHVFSQMLINLGLDENKIKFVLDNSKIKKDKRLYGTDLIVKSPEFLRDKKDVTVILRAGAYQQEIKKQIRNISKNVKFIE